MKYNTKTRTFTLDNGTTVTEEALAAVRGPFYELDRTAAMVFDHGSNHCVARFSSVSDCVEYLTELRGPEPAIGGKQHFHAYVRVDLPPPPIRTRRGSANVVRVAAEYVKSQGGEVDSKLVKKLADYVSRPIKTPSK